MNLRTILFSQYPALFLLAVLFLIAHLRVRKRSAVKSVLWVILFGAALAASVVCCFLGIQAELWTLKTLITLGFWSWFGVGLVLLFLVLRVVHGMEKRSSRRRLDKAMKQAEKQKEEEVTRARAEGAAAEREDKTLRSLAAMCGLSAAPKRMESYDISNTGASDIVASMVVYEGAKPKRSAYRRFKIKSLSAHPDDYASMEEVLTRRIQRYLDGDEKFSPLPDVMLIDGGITHAGVAERVCAQMHVRVPIFGMVKDDRHRTRALVTAQGREIDLHAAPNVFALIGQIQEETHRFAITFHHESHSGSSTRSALDGIPGVGKVRAQALLKTFKSVRAIREADIFALERVLPKDAAASVYLHFHGETDEKKDEM